MFYEPTLIVNEMSVTRGPEVAYSASFHLGVNIIAGENSSGKSTLLSLLVYGLGADISKWSEQARLCDSVYLEVTLNGNPVTLRRDIAEGGQKEMQIFPGRLEEAKSAPVTNWNAYPYRTSASRESFSQAIFRILNIPELETDSSGKLTMHQLLRVLYSDQLSAVEKIFREENFDTPALRDAIGRLLFGAHESSIYRNQLQIRELEKENQIISSSLKSIYALLAGVQHSLTSGWLEAERRNIAAKIAAVSDEIERVQGSESKADISLAPQETAFLFAAAAQAKLLDLQKGESSLELEIADSELFIATLDAKIASLQDSSAVAASISEVKYSSCPSCFALIEQSDSQTTCHLCKQPFDEDRLRQRIVRQINDLVVQRKQSRFLQQGRSSALAKVKSELSDTRSEWERARIELTRVSRTPTSEFQDRLRKLNEEAGYLRREMESLGDKAKLIERIDEMSRQMLEINSSIGALKDENDRLRALSAERLSKASSEVADETIYFLHGDLPRQDSFENASSVGFSFAEDRISVNGETYFSASSKVYLKNSFLSAILFSAAKDPQFRHPRFLVLDTIEDKGMEPERSQNFQRLLVDRSAQTETDHQIIFATAMINPDLDLPEYVVGRKSTHNSRTLLIG